MRKYSAIKGKWRMNQIENKTKSDLHIKKKRKSE